MDSRKSEWLTLQGVRSTVCQLGVERAHPRVIFSTWTKYVRVTQKVRVDHVQKSGLGNFRLCCGSSSLFSDHQHVGRRHLIYSSPFSLCSSFRQNQSLCPQNYCEVALFYFSKNPGTNFRCAQSSALRSKLSTGSRAGLSGVGGGRPLYICHF